MAFSASACTSNVRGICRRRSVRRSAPLFRPLSKVSYCASASAACSSVSMRCSRLSSVSAPGRDAYHRTGAEWMSLTASTPIDDSAALTSERMPRRSCSLRPQQMTLQWEWTAQSCSLPESSLNRSFSSALALLAPSVENCRMYLVLLERSERTPCCESFTTYTLQMCGYRDSMSPTCDARQRSTSEVAELMESTRRTLDTLDGRQSLSERMNDTVVSSFTRTLSGVRATSESIPVPRVITCSIRPPRPSGPVRSSSVSLRALASPPAVATAINSSLLARNSTRSLGEARFLGIEVPKSPLLKVERSDEDLPANVR